MSNPARRFAVISTWNDGCTRLIGSHLEERPDGIYCLASDIRARDTTIAEQAATIEGLREALGDMRWRFASIEGMAEEHKDAADAAALVEKEE